MPSPHSVSQFSLLSSQCSSFVASFRTLAREALPLYRFNKFAKFLKFEAWDGASGSFLTTHLDILFTILSFLPLEDLARAKLVCRSWFELIRSPSFLLAHCTRATPIAAFFTYNRNLPGTQDFKPFFDSEKFPNYIRGFLENQNRVVSTSHGLLCLRNENNIDNTYVVGNPATSMWAVLNDDIAPSGFFYRGTALIFDPSVSYHFKLAVAMFKLGTNELNKHYIRFHIYSSETCSWTASAVHTVTHNTEDIIFGLGGRLKCYCKPCKIGGGSVCWTNDFCFLVGYDISTDNYWKTPLPIFDEMHTHGLTGHDGDVYCISLGSAEGKVWRLEGRNNWVLEGEAKNEGLLNSVPFAYEKARGALLVGGRRNNELCAFHLSTSTLEVIREGEGFPWENFDRPEHPHANSLAPFYGGELTNWG